LLAYSIGEGAIVDGAWLQDTLHWLAGQGTHDDAFQALVMVGWSHADEVLPVLRQLMTTTDPQTRVRAAEAAGRLGPRDDARQALRRVAANPAVDLGWRIVAAWSMARLDATKEAVALLQGLMQQQERELGVARIDADTLTLNHLYSFDSSTQSLVLALSEIGTPDAVQVLAEIGGRRLPLGADAAVSAVISLHRLGHGGRACALIGALDRMPLPARDRRRIGDARRELRCLEVK
jgi:HEAT repeat protein